MERLESVWEITPARHESSPFNHAEDPIPDEPFQAKSIRATLVRLVPEIENRLTNGIVFEVTVAGRKSEIENATDPVGIEPIRRPDVASE